MSSTPNEILRSIIAEFGPLERKLNNDLYPYFASTQERTVIKTVNDIAVLIKFYCGPTISADHIAVTSPYGNIVAVMIVHAPSKAQLVVKFAGTSGEDRMMGLGVKVNEMLYKIVNGLSKLENQ